MLTALAVPAAMLPLAINAGPALRPENDRRIQVVFSRQKVVVDGNGGEKLEDVAIVKPGDLIEYVATYRNTGSRPVDGLVATLPVPEGLECPSGRTKPRPLLAVSWDGAYTGEPQMRKRADGVGGSVPCSEFRSLRWELGRLPAGGRTGVISRARVESVSSPSTSSSVATNEREMQPASAVASR